MEIVKGSGVAQGELLEKVNSPSDLKKLNPNWFVIYVEKPNLLGPFSFWAICLVIYAFFSLRNMKLL